MHFSTNASHWSAPEARHRHIRSASEEVLFLGAHQKHGTGTSEVHQRKCFSLERTRSTAQAHQKCNRGSALPWSAPEARHRHIKSASEVLFLGAHQSYALARRPPQDIRNPCASRELGELELHAAGVAELQSYLQIFARSGLAERWESLSCMQQGWLSSKITLEYPHTPG